MRPWPAFVPAIVLLCAALAAGPALANNPFGERPFTPFKVISSNPDLTEAFSAARKTLPSAIGAMQKSGGRFSPSLAFRVALVVPNTERPVELIWVDSIRRHGSLFKARLAGWPRGWPGEGPGTEVTFAYSQIADWAVQAVDGRFYGYYTTRVELQTAPAATRARYGPLLIDNPLPPDWRFN
ncbi:DUF2314 domain-containing protein [Pseudoponticoccus marisrubri]|uniref:DUF2314 domain-containing protein n=1 Tax=Pseudoponticoccus marisrubri TaxID=1685382 RepID=A0A0W7WNB7_9RHOB|nr:DUF2314 domain-containing protein [Pseudoponticoccus marisrubri]KUF12060.1 hypothetical protein AVJ23_05665 [Pseudoponticoccus marisrubri]